MPRHENNHLSADSQRELDVIDAALAGEAVAGPGSALAELAVVLREVRPRPSAQFARALDARAAHGFGRVRRPAGPGPGSRLGARLRDLPRLPALGIAASAAALVAGVVALTLVGSNETPAPTRSPTAHALRTGPNEATPGTAKSDLAPAGAVPARPETSAGAASAVPGAPARQVERSSALEVGVAPGSLQAAAQRVFTLVDAYGGYISQSNVSSGEREGGASFDVRLPTANVAGAIAALSRLGHVRSESDNTNDVTERYGALRRSIGDAQAERSSLLKQLAAAAGSARAAELRARLRALEARLGSLQAQLQALRTRIDYTPLALSLAVEHHSGGGAGPLTPGKAAGDAAHVLDVGLAVLVIAASAALPFALVAIAGWLVVALLRRRLREQALDAST
jgi:hypothetical protein